MLIENNVLKKVEASDCINGEFIIPECVTQIGDWAFKCCTGLTSITIGDSVRSIGDHAFESCTGLTSITIPSSVTSIGDWVFLDCTSLASITIPDSVTSIGLGIFFLCPSLAHIIIDASSQENYELIIDDLLLEDCRDIAITPSGFLSQVGVKSGPKRDTAINLLIKGRKPDNEVDHELYNHWQKFREEVLLTRGQGHTKITTLKNLCLFAVKKDMGEDEIQKRVEFGMLGYKQHTPKTSGEILKEFNDWAMKNIQILTQASSSSASSALTI